MELDRANFHRKVTGVPGFLTPTGEVREGGRGRPARVYRGDPGSPCPADPPRRPLRSPQSHDQQMPAPMEERLAGPWHAPGGMGEAPVGGATGGSGC